MPYAPDSYPRQIPQFKIHGRGEVTVSAKGIITGDSNIPNDGADFGPDTMLGATGPGQYGPPYSISMGVGEACGFIHSNGGGVVKLKNIGSAFIISSQITIYQDTSIYGNFATINYSPTADEALFSIGSISNPNHIIRDLVINLSSAPSGKITTILTTTTMNKLIEYENITLNANSLSKYGFTLGNSSNVGLNNCYVTDVTDYAYYISGGGTGIFFNNCNYDGKSQGDGSYAYYWGGGDTLRITGGRIEAGNGIINFNSSTYNCTQAYLVNVESDAGSNVVMFTIGNFNITQISFVNCMITNPSDTAFTTATLASATGYLSDIFIIGGIFVGAGNGFLYLYNVAMNNGSFSVDGAFIQNNNTGGVTTIGEFNNPFITGTIIVTNCIISPSPTDVLARAPVAPYSISFDNCIMTGSWSNPVLGNVIFGRNINAPLPAASLSANPPVTATVYQNTNPYDIEIDLPVYATTAGTAGYVTIAKGATSTPVAIGNQYVNGATSSTSTDIIKLRVPAGWYYSFTASGVTFGTASVFAD